MPGFRWGVTGLEQTNHCPQSKAGGWDEKRKLQNTKGVRNNMEKTQKGGKMKKLKSKLDQNSLAVGLPTKPFSPLMLNTQQSQSISLSNTNKLESNVLSFLVLKNKPSITASIFLVVKNLLDCWSDILNLQENSVTSITETINFYSWLWKAAQ